MRKRVICDSSSLISLSMNCMLPLIVEMSDTTDFIITKSVYDEIITNPRMGKHHRMGPLKFTALTEGGILQTERADPKEVNEILDLSNSIYFARHKPLKIIQKGEAEALWRPQSASLTEFCPYPITDPCCSSAVRYSVKTAGRPVARLPRNRR